MIRLETAEEAERFCVALRQTVVDLSQHQGDFDRVISVPATQEAARRGMIAWLLDNAAKNFHNRYLAHGLVSLGRANALLAEAKGEL